MRHLYEEGLYCSESAVHPALDCLLATAWNARHLVGYLLLYLPELLGHLGIVGLAWFSCCSLAELWWFWSALWQWPSNLVFLCFLVGESQQRVVIPFHFFEISANDAVDLLKFLHFNLMILIRFLNPPRKLTLLILLCLYALQKQTHFLLAGC